MSISRSAERFVMTRGVATALIICLLGVSLPVPVGAHHVGVFTPKDDDITKNFKHIKSAGQAGAFEVALKLFDDGILHDTMEKHEKGLPSGLEDGLRASLRARDFPGVELRLSIFLAFLARERVRDARARLKNLALSPELRRDHARKILNAAWRYYNLADFVITRQDPKAAAALRVAFEDAQTYLGGMMVDPMWAASGEVKPAPPDDGKAATTVALMERTLGEVIRDGARIARSGRANEFLPRQ